MELLYIWPVLVGVIGLLVGSFFNALEYRLINSIPIAVDSGEAARSACVHCSAVLQPQHLIPVVSFIALRGRCHACSESISWQYPIVELATALLGAWVAWHFGFSAETAVYVVFVWVLLFIFLYDLKHQLILDVITLPAIVSGGIAAVLLGWDLQSSMIGALIGGGFFAVQFIVSNGKWIGGGDIRLGALMGVVLGWSQTLAALFLAYVGGAVVAVILLARKKAGMDSRLPFGVFLTIATVIMLLYGQEIIEWYIQLAL